jgi:hypothetical protein
MEKNVQLKYRLYRRRNGVFYWQENNSKSKEHFAQPIDAKPNGS